MNADTTPDTQLSRASALVMAVVSVAAVVLAIILTGPIASPSTTAAGSGAHGASPQAVTPTGQTTHVEVSIRGMAFVPSRVEVPAGNALHLTIRNEGDQRHDLVFANGATTGQISPGASVELTLDPLGADLQGWCSLPGHRAAGMTFDVVVTGASASAGATSRTDTTAQAGAGHAHAHHGAHGHNHWAMASSAGVPTMHELIEYNKTITPYPAALAPAPAAKTHHITLRASEHMDLLAPGVERAVWSFNGITPGPILRGKVGDTVHITLINDGTMGHSIDFHAGDIAPDQVMRTIEPGESLEYVFEAKRAGIWMYHCSTAPMSLHIATGMHGAVIIDPTDLDPVDREYALVASELYLGGEGGAANPDKLAALAPDLATFNGRPFQYTAHPLEAKVGETVRMWVLNAGPNITTAFHVVGTQFDTVWAEGDYLIRGRGAGGGGSQVLPLVAAEGGFVEFTPVEPGTYTFVNHVMSVAEKGAHGVIKVSK